MGGMVRVYTVEEAKALPPPTDEEREARAVVIASIRAHTDEWLTRRGGVPFTTDEILALLDREPDDDSAQATPK